MKFVKKLTALFLAVCMVMAMGITAFAAGVTTTDTGTVSITADGHTYKVYQIFTATMGGTDGKTLSDVKWGQNGTGYVSGQVTDVPDDTLEAIKALSNNTQATADAIAKYVDLNSTPVATLNDGATSASVLTGYYLIVDAGKTEGATDSYSTYVIGTVTKNGTLTVSPKKDVPSFEKKVDDKNDTTGEENKKQDSADYDIGDDVPFTLTITIPQNYGDYSEYYLEFQDQMEKGLTFNDDVKVTVNGNDITGSFTKGTLSAVSGGAVNTDGASAFKYTCSDLKKVSGVSAGSVITVTYSAKLNENAVLGSTGNVNEAKLIYSNNPNSDGKGDKGETPWDAVIVFTYQTVVNKVDQDEQPLTGAEFTLYKKVKQSDGSTKEEAIQAVKAESGTQFTFKGLDDGNYVLRETTTPDGYSTAADVEFTITAEHKVEWKDVTRTNILTSLKGGSLGDGKVDTGTIETTVENKQGSTLPSTGGMGTAVIYMAGIAMIVAAGVVVIARKRMA